MIFFVDCETTGTDYWRNEILTKSLVVTDYDLKILEIETFKFRPEFDTWDRESERIHGITYNEASTFGDKRSAYTDMLEFIESFGSNHMYVCHAFPMFGKLDYFDYQFSFSPVRDDILCLL